jgi:hypothetical protein
MKKESKTMSKPSKRQRLEAVVEAAQKAGMPESHPLMVRWRAQLAPKKVAAMLEVRPSTYDTIIALRKAQHQSS